MCCLLWRIYETHPALSLKPGCDIQAGQGDLGEESRPRGGGIGHAKAQASSDEGRGTLWTSTRARNMANLAGRRAGEAN
jgi:hypothetical protein